LTKTDIKKNLKKSKKSLQSVFSCGIISSSGGDKAERRRTLKIEQANGKSTLSHIDGRRLKACASHNIAAYSAYLQQNDKKGRKVFP